MAKNKRIKESVIDYKREGLDTKIFTSAVKEAHPVLQPDVKDQLLDGADKFEEMAVVGNVYLVGSILTYYYADDCDLDVTIEIASADVSDKLKDDLIDLVIESSGKLAAGTKHPINYH